MSDEELDIFDYDDENDVDLDTAKKAPSNRVERFKGEQGVTYRVALMYFHPLSQTLAKAAKAKAKKEGTEVDKASVKAAYDKLLAKQAEELGKSVDELAEWEKLDTKRPQFKKYRSHYKEGVGIVLSRLGKDGPEADKVWAMLGDPSEYYSTALLVYATDREGNVDMESVLSRSYVKPYRFSNGVYNRLIEINQKLKSLGHSLATFDLMMKCKNDKFQNFDIDFAEQAIWVKSKKVREKFLPLAHSLYPKIVDAREISTADLRNKLGIGGDSGSDVADDEEMEDLLDSV